MSVRSAAIVAVLIFVLCSLAAAPRAVELNGQFTSELYVTDRDGESHVRPYERLRADLTVLPNTDGKSLLLHSYLRWTSDLSHKRTTDPQTFVYDTYFKLTGYPDRSTIYLGRQFVYNGVGSVLMDGLRFSARLSRSATVDIFGGSSVSSLDPERFRSLSDFGTMGGRLSFRAGDPGLISLNWMLTRSDGYTVSHRAGLEGRLSFRAVQFYGRFVYNATTFRAASVLLRSSYVSNGWYVSGEFSWREPSVSSNSLFSLIDFYRYKEIRADMQRRVWRSVTAIGQMHVGSFDQDESWRTGIGLRAGMFSIMWRHQSGYGGKNDAVYGSANVRLRKGWEAYAGANVGRYRIQEAQIDLSDAYTGRVGVLWRTGRGIMAGVEGQYVRNAVESNDFRAYLRVSADFSWAGKNGDGRR